MSYQTILKLGDKAEEKEVAKLREELELARQQHERRDFELRLQQRANEELVARLASAEQLIADQVAARKESENYEQRRQYRRA